MGTNWLSQQMPDLNTCPPDNSPTTTQPPPTTTTTPLPTTTTTEAVCYEDQIPVLKTYKVIKKVKTWTLCRQKCNEDSACQYFRYKNHKGKEKDVLLTKCTICEEEWVYT